MDDEKVSAPVTEKVCPDCGCERADYEGVGKFLTTCPNCGSRCAPADQMHASFPIRPSREPERCPVCDWPMSLDQADGCRPNNCTFRPIEGSADWYRIKRRRAELGLDNLAGAKEPSASGEGIPDQATWDRRIDEQLRIWKYLPLREIAGLFLDIQDRRDALRASSPAPSPTPSDDWDARHEHTASPTDDEREKAFEQYMADWYGCAPATGPSDKEIWSAAWQAASATFKPKDMGRLKPSWPKDDEVTR